MENKDFIKQFVETIKYLEDNRNKIINYDTKVKTINDLEIKLNEYKKNSEKVTRQNQSLFRYIKMLELSTNNSICPQCWWEWWFEFWNWNWEVCSLCCWGWIVSNESKELYCKDNKNIDNTPF